MLVPAGVHELHEPHAALDQAAGHQAVVGERALLASRRGPYMSRTCCGSFERSVSSGTLVCILYAISYWAMRVAISGSPKSLQLQLVELGEVVEQRRGGRRGSCRRGSTGRAPGRRCRGTSRPGTRDGRKPLPQ